VTTTREIQYDYDNQAWIIDGIYQNCAHPDDARLMDNQQLCECYGREHEGEAAPNIH